jgi:hypothetical protein
MALIFGKDIIVPETIGNSKIDKIQKELNDKASTDTVEAIKSSLEEQINVKADISSLSSVASSNSYNDLDDKPTIPSKTSELENDSDYSVNTDVVHKTGDEIISGIKTYTDTIFRKNNDTDYTTAPSSDTITKALHIRDKNDETFGAFETVSQQDGSNVIRMNVRGQTNWASQSLGLGVTSSGTTYAYAPTPASATENSNQIATTEWIDKKFKVVSELPVEPEDGVIYLVTEE